MISIIVPIYGVEPYIRQCVESLLGQTNPDIEILLVDDGSKDGCPGICDEYAARDARVRVIHKENGGLVSARQAGMRAARGDYVTFVDGDDFVESDLYENVRKMIDLYAPDLIAFDFFADAPSGSTISEQRFQKEFYDKAALEAEIYPTMLFSGKFYRFGIAPCCWSKVFRRKLLEKHLFCVDPHTKMGEDAAFTYPCLLDASRVCYIRKPLYHYRILASSMSHGYDPHLAETILLPYLRLKAVNAESSFDFSGQLDYYLIYLFNFRIRNEAKSLGKRSDAEIRKDLSKAACLPDLRRAASRVRIRSLPMHTKLLVLLIRMRSGIGVYAYAKLLKNHL